MENKGVTKCKANTVLNEMYLCGLATVDKYYMPPHSTREKIKSCQQIRLPFKSDDIICSEKSLGGPKFGGNSFFCQTLRQSQWYPVLAI